MKAELGRVLTAMVTPFTEDLKVNYDEAQRLASYLIESGSDGIVVSGTTGESPTINYEEKLELYKAVKEAVKDKGTVIAGTGDNCTQDSIEFTRAAERIGVDAAMLVTPYYNKPPQQGLYQHFQTIANYTSLPVILYNIPSRSVVNIDAETTIALSEIENIVAVKEASGNLEQIAKIISQTPPDFAVYSGDDSATYPILALGGKGVISVASHIIGKEIKNLVVAGQNNQWEEALKLHHRLLPLFEALFITTNPIMVKAALNLKGFNVGGLRLPLIEATEAQKQKLKKIMEKFGIIS